MASQIQKEVFQFSRSLGRHYQTNRLHQAKCKSHAYHILLEMETKPFKLQDRMIPKQLQWKIQDSQEVWIAQINEYGLVQFEIHQLPQDKYLLKSNLMGIKDLMVDDLDFTKQLAQYQLETHIHSLIETGTDEK